MTTKFTPGKWHANPTHLGNAFDIGSEDNDNICLVRGPNENGSDNFKDNAALISSAPELYEALVEARDTLAKASRILTNDCSHVLRGKEWGGSTFDVIDAALAKARGETP